MIEIDSAKKHCLIEKALGNKRRLKKYCEDASKKVSKLFTYITLLMHNQT